MYRIFLKAQKTRCALPTLLNYLFIVFIGYIHFPNIAQKILQTCRQYDKTMRRYEKAAFI